MANANTEVDLTALHQAIEADIIAAFPQLATVGFYMETEAGGRKLPPMPACFLELSEFEGANDIDPGTGQLAVTGRFAARVAIGFKTANAKIAIRTLAAGLAAWLRKRKWVNPSNSAKKLPTGAAEVIGAFPDEFSPELDQCEVWRIEWTQVIHLGDGYEDDGTLPTQILFSWAPEIGIPHEADYKPLGELEPPP